MEFRKVDRAVRDQEMPVVEVCCEMLCCWTSLLKFRDGTFESVGETESEEYGIGWLGASECGWSERLK